MMVNRSRPSPAMVVALIALFVALGGTATALNGSNTVFSDDIVAKNVKQGDINTGAVTTAKVLDNNLTGADIANTSSLGDVEIDESSLDTVPTATNAANAGTATNAGRVDGVNAQTFNFEGGTTSGEVTVLTLGGLTLAADCDSGPDVQLFADTATDDSFISSNAAGIVDNNWDAVSARKQVEAAGNGSGIVTYRNGSPGSGLGTDTLSVTFAYEESLAPAETGADCNVIGTVLGSND